MSTTRKNVTMSIKLAEWYEDKAKELGVSQSSLMTMALGDYIKQDQAFSVMGNMENLIKQLERLKNMENQTPKE